MSKLSKYLTDAGEVPDDVLIGNLVFFTIRDGSYAHDAIKQSFTDLGLDEGRLPAPDNPINGFKKACSDLDEFSYRIDDDRTGIVLIRLVTNEKEFLRYALVREIRDGRQKKLVHETVGFATFWKARTHQGKVDPSSARAQFTLNANSTLTAEERRSVSPLLTQLRSRYERYRDYMDDMKIRAMVREYVKGLNSVAVKGGVYFSYIDRVNELRRLQELVNERLGFGCFMHLVPLIDVPAQREFVVKAAQEESVNELERLAVEIATLRERRQTITPAAFGRLYERYDEVMRRAEEHTRSLGLTQSATAGAAEACIASLDALAEEMRGTDE